MHSSEPLPVAPATGPILLQQLGRLIIRARSVSPHRNQRDTRDRLLQAKLRAANPSTSSQVLTQPKGDGQRGVEAKLDSHVHALWTEQIPVCIEVLLSPDCSECASALSRVDDEECERLPPQRGLLLERWTMTPLVHKSHERPAFITSQWLLNAVRSQLHFSQISAWMHTLKGDENNPNERRRKLSREQCNIKKIESNCDDIDQSDDERKLNIVYSIKIPGESYKMAEFTKPPTDHAFPVTDIGNNVYLKVNLESLPRLDEIPNLKCKCQKRRASKEISVQSHDELLTKLNDLSLTGQQKYEMNNINSNTGSSSRRLSIITNPNLTEFLFKTAEDVNVNLNLNKDKTELLDDRMHTNCSENGKHKCNCDEDSDRPTTDFKPETKKIDEKRLKEIAKYKRRVRKENLKKLYDSTSSEGEGLKKEKHTSIPILQASRFDRFRAIGCYRNQTYLTLPASRMESRSPFVDAISIPPAEHRKTLSVSTQTDDLICQCGVQINMKCDECRMVRSNANYDLASINVNEDKRKLDDDTKSSKKLKCDNFISIKCDMLDDVSASDSLIKRPKIRRYLPFVDRFDRVISDRLNKESDLEQLHLKSDDTVFSTPKPEKRQKTFSVGDDYVMYEKCDYGTIDRCEIESPKDDGGFTPPESGFKYPESTKSSESGARSSESSTTSSENGTKSSESGTRSSESGTRSSESGTKSSESGTKTSESGTKNSESGNDVEPSNSGANVNGCNPDGGTSSNGHDGEQSQVPSPSEMDRFRWRFDSAASMVFHTKTGLPLTSSPAPLRRGNNCFDFDDSINGISGIKSALFHPIPCGVTADISAKAVPSPAPTVSAHRQSFKKLNLGPSTGLLGSFEESALKGRLEPVATVAGFTAELGASGACCPPHRRLPVTVFFYAPGGTNAPYMGHINLGASGYRVSRSGTIQVSLFNPHGTLVKMFVVLYDLTCMPPNAKTFLRQRTLYMPVGAEPPAPHHLYKWLRYLIHLRFMTSKSGKLYLHTDIRILVSRKSDMDTATAHSALFRPIPTNHGAPATPPANQGAAIKPPTNREPAVNVKVTDDDGKAKRTPNRVFGGCSDYDESKMPEIGYENQNGVSYELRSFTYAPENPRYSLR